MLIRQVRMRLLVVVRGQVRACYWVALQEQSQEVCWVVQRAQSLAKSPRMVEVTNTTIITGNDERRAHT